MDHSIQLIANFENSFCLIAYQNCFKILGFRFVKQITVQIDWNDNILSNGWSVELTKSGKIRYSDSFVMNEFMPR